MPDRTELVEAALENLPEGIALFNGEDHVVFWNRAAEAISGYASMEVLGRSIPAGLYPLLSGTYAGEQDKYAGGQTGDSMLVVLEHKLGHSVTAAKRNLMLRDGMGARIGLAALFHPAESLDALPHGECGEGSTVRASQAEFEERLESAFADFQNGGDKFGVLWITVDQAQELRKTHGAGACEAMIGKVERALAGGLRLSEEIGRWGDDEFLVLSHERTQEMLAAHAQLLAGLARTADFRWWGDRVSITVSIGAAQAEQGVTLVALMEKAKAAMFTSLHAGGNQITAAPGGQSCSPS